MNIMVPIQYLIYGMEHMVCSTKSTDHPSGRDDVLTDDVDFLAAIDAHGLHLRQIYTRSHWVAVKELTLSYHNLDTSSKECGFGIMVT